MTGIYGSVNGVDSLPQPHEAGYGSGIAVGLTKQGNYTQTYSTAVRTVDAATATAVATTATTQTTPYGFSTSAQGDALVTAVNALIADNLVLRKLINALIDDSQANGLAG